MWTDGRYYLQAQKQLYEGWDMMKMEAGIPPYFEWIKENIPSGTVIGVDDTQIPAQTFNLRRDLFEKSGIKLVSAGSNLVDELWADEKPQMPNEKVWILANEYTG